MVTLIGILTCLVVSPGHMEEWDIEVYVNSLDTAFVEGGHRLEQIRQDHFIDCSFKLMDFLDQDLVNPIHDRVCFFGAKLF